MTKNCDVINSIIVTKVKDCKKALKLIDLRHHVDFFSKFRAGWNGWSDGSTKYPNPKTQAQNTQTQCPTIPKIEIATLNN